MKITVIIPTYGRPEMTAAAARSALKQTLPKGWTRELIVVDDGGKDNTGPILKKIKGLTYIWKNHAGPAAARNHGAKLAKGELLAFLDSDTVAQPNWLSAGIKRLSKEKSLFAVEGKVLPDREAIQTPFTEAVQNPGGGRWLSCNLFVRRKEFLTLGGFDERYKQPIREDSEFAFRALESGKQIAFEPAALVTHPVREVGISRFFYHAQEGRYEALLSGDHPESYRKHFKWLDGRAIPIYYWGHLAALILAVSNTRLALALIGCGVLITIYAWCRQRVISPLDPIRLLIPAFFAPFLRFFWVATGHLYYPKSPE